MIWTFQTHFPYFAGAADGAHMLSGPDAPEDEWSREHMARYLSALHEADRLIGELVRFVEASGLAKSTLIVIVGDHGEAFNQHGTFAHGGTLYDENVHVPLLLINPGIAPGRFARVTGQVDLAPTIA